MNMHIHQQLFFIKLLLVICESKMIPLIVNGADAKIGNYPHSVYLGVDCMIDRFTEGGHWMCGSSVLTQKVLLTAAHCMSSCSRYSTIVVSAGHAVALKGVNSTVMKYIVHSDYNEENIDISKDIALVRLKTQLRLGRNVKRIAVMEHPQGIKEAELAGWGVVDEVYHIQAKKLQRAKQYLVDRQSCLRILKEIPPGCFCAAGKVTHGYAAPGDSGSALIVRGYIQIGLVSYKVPKLSKTVVIYTNVTHYYNWIEDQLEKISC